MINFATISADVISYTYLSETEKRKLESAINSLLSDLTDRYSNYQFYGRLVQGDYIECALNNPASSLRIALLLKTLVKSINLDTTKGTKSRLKYFFEHGVRLAVAIAPLQKVDPKLGIIDGEAIYLSGRTIKSYSTSDKQRITIKNSMFFCGLDNEVQEQYDTMFSLLDTILSKCSAKQSEVVYNKLLDLSEKDIAEKLGKNQSTISQHSTAAGWLSIEKAVNYFENSVKQWH